MNTTRDVEIQLFCGQFSDSSTDNPIMVNGTTYHLPIEYYNYINAYIARTIDIDAGNIAFYDAAYFAALFGSTTSSSIYPYGVGAGGIDYVFNTTTYSILSSSIPAVNGIIDAVTAVNPSILSRENILRTSSDVQIPSVRSKIYTGRVNTGTIAQNASHYTNSNSGVTPKSVNGTSTVTTPTKSAVVGPIPGTGTITTTPQGKVTKTYHLSDIANLPSTPLDKGCWVYAKLLIPNKLTSDTSCQLKTATVDFVKEYTALKFDNADDPVIAPATTPSTSTTSTSTSGTTASTVTPKDTYPSTSKDTAVTSFLKRFSIQ